jgi:Cu(I)/Ag(I) efflux system membrane fusion protein
VTSPFQRARYAAALGAFAAAAVIVGLLLLQSARHGWPFSLHHDHAGPRYDATVSDRTHETHGATPEQTVATDSTASARTRVALETAQFERLGVRVAAARLEPIADVARHPATIAPDESRISHVHARVSGWIEELFVNTTGESVRAGQPIAAVFSQDLFASQTEYLAALRQSRQIPGSAVPAAARTRLAVLGMSEQEIVALERAGTAQRLVTVAAPQNGIVLRRGVSVGTAIDPATELATIADLSQVWVLAEVPEAPAARVAVGAMATLSFPTAGGMPFAASVDFVYPTLSERTRSVRVRFVVPNPAGVLRPGLYGTASFDAPGREALVIPREAVVETGEAQHVFVHSAPGTFEPRAVRLGARFADSVEVLEGLTAGEEVVSSGVFLIDSESKLRASSSGAGHMGHGEGAAPDNADRP